MLESKLPSAHWSLSSTCGKFVLYSVAPGLHIEPPVIYQISGSTTHKELSQNYELEVMKGITRL